MQKYQMICNVCKKVKNANPKAFLARIEKFGGEIEMRAKWICRECAKKAKEGKTPDPEQDTREENLKRAKQAELENIPTAESSEESKDINF